MLTVEQALSQIKQTLNSIDTKDTEQALSQVDLIVCERWKDHIDCVTTADELQQR